MLLENIDGVWLPAARWGGGAMVLLVMHLLFRRLPKGDSPATPAGGGPWDRCDAVALGLLAAMALLFYMGACDVFPVPPDGYYHLRVAQNMLDTGRIPLWNTWEFAPEGRPHLYPPLYHLLLAGTAWILGGDLTAAFQVVQPMVPCLVCGAAWLLARALFGSRHALAALLLTGADACQLVMAFTATPGMLAQGFMLLMLLAFVRGRGVVAGLLGGLAFNTHLGVAPFALLGLGLYCLWERRHGRRFAVCLGVAVLLALPWYVRVIAHHDLFVHPLTTGFYGDFPAWQLPFVKMAWLHLLNLGLVLLTLHAVPHLPRRDSRYRLVFAVTAAFLPTFFSYGGRYVANTLPFWAMFAAARLTPLLKPPRRKRRLLALAALALAPTVSLVGFGTVVSPGPVPMVSAWWGPPAVAAEGLRLLGHGERLGLMPYEDLSAAAEWIRAQTDPDQIIHFPGRGYRDWAVTVGYLAHRRTSGGAWEESGPAEAVRAKVRAFALEDPRGIYIARSTRNIPRDCTVHGFGSLRVGLRD